MGQTPSNSDHLHPSLETLEKYMAQALAQAELGAKQNEVPVGALVIGEEGVIAQASNRREEKNDPTAHAEILAIREASRIRGSWRLNDCLLCVTLEPCTMCIGAIREARIPLLVFGAHDSRVGACGSIYDLSQQKALGPVPRVVQGIQSESCARVLQEFFQKLRSGKSKRDA